MTNQNQNPNLKSDNSGAVYESSYSGNYPMSNNTSYQNKKQPLPAFVEATLSLFWAIILITGIAVALISYMSGCVGLELLIRSGSATLFAGTLLWFASWIIAHGSLETAKKMMEQEEAELAKDELIDDEDNIDLDSEEVEL